MIKLLIVLVVGFAAGFITHAVYFPDYLSNGIVDIQKVALPNSVPTQASGGNPDEFETKITYTNGKFSRHNIAIGLGTYLSVINMSPDHLMWLISSEPAFTTSRGYGESEQVKQRMEVRGQIVVADKNNPSEKLVITVK